MGLLPKSWLAFADLVRCESKQSSIGRKLFCRLQLAASLAGSVRNPAAPAKFPRLLIPPNPFAEAPRGAQRHAECEAASSRLISPEVDSERPRNIVGHSRRCPALL